MLAEQMKVVREKFTPEQIKKVWVISTGARESWEFHGPNGEYLYNLKTADCAWSAKAEGWSKLCEARIDEGGETV